MVRPKIVNLLQVNRRPEICADELHRVQFIFEARHLAC